MPERGTVVGIHAPRTVLRQNPELLRRVGEEAHPPPATGAVLARLRAVTRGVEPALEDAVRVLARVAFLAISLAEIGARRAGVVILPRVTAARLLPRVGVRTLRPVM